VEKKVFCVIINTQKGRKIMEKKENNLKKTLKIAGILCLLVAVFDVAELMMDFFYYDFSVFYIVIDSVAIALSIVTGVLYLTLMNKEKDYLVKHKNTFLVLTILNIFNGIVAWILSFWVLIVVGREQTGSIWRNFDTQSPTPNSTSGTEKKSDVELDESSYEERKIAKDLTDKLEELNRLKDKKLITEEEYKKMREDAINNFGK
jgi:hypothetical protein